MSGINSKKGISNIIATLIIISVTLLVAGILFIAVRNLIEIKLSPPDLCLEETLKIKNACYNQETKDLEITLTKIPGKKITKIDFIVEFEKDSSLFSCYENCDNCKILKHGTKTYYIQTEETPKKIIIKANNCPEGKKTISDC